jgi:hypothetical protein
MQRSLQSSYGMETSSLSRWPCGRSCRSKAASLSGSWVRIPLWAWMFVTCVCCVLCRKRPLRWADHSLRGVISAGCGCVCLIVCGSTCVWYNTQQWGFLDLSCAVASQENKIHASNFFKWFGFPFGVGVMTETKSIKIKKNARNKTEIQKKVDNKWRRTEKETSGEEEKKLKELRVWK